MAPSDFLKIAERSGLKEIQTGAITVEKFWVEFSRISGITVVEDLWVKFFNPRLNAQTVQIINQLKAVYRVVAGTNTIESHYRVHLKRCDYRFFDKVYASHLIGYQKPDHQFYIHILKQEGAAPTQAVFIDDTKENVEAALNLGIQSFLFTNAEELRQRLLDLRLLPST